MVRDLEKERKKIRNGNRYIEDIDGTGVFSRDVDRLFMEYTNLRKSIYNKQKYKFPDQATRDELSSYIDEEFVKLVKEYDINGPIDFPGYVKNKLNMRVSQVFIKGRYRDKGREQLLADEQGMKNLLDYKEGESYQQERSNEIKGLIVDDLNLTELEEFILSIWLSEKLPQSKVVTQVTNNYDMNRKEAEAEIEELKEYLVPRLEPFLRKKEE